MTRSPDLPISPCLCASVAAGRKSLKYRHIRSAHRTLISLKPLISAVRYKAVKGSRWSEDNEAQVGDSQVSPLQVYLCIYMGAAFSALGNGNQRGFLSEEMR